jgi:hypothetical protein
MRKKKYSPEWGDNVAFSRIGSVLEYTLRRYAKLAKEYNFVFLMVDNENFYKPFLEEAKSDFSASLIHIGTSEWEKDIRIPSLKIPPELRKIPKDGHYAVGYNRIIANKLADTLEKNFVLSRIK